MSLVNFTLLFYKASGESSLDSLWESTISLHFEKEFSSISSLLESDPKKKEKEEDEEDTNESLRTAPATFSGLLRDDLGDLKGKAITAILLEEIEATQICAGDYTIALSDSAHLAMSKVCLVFVFRISKLLTTFLNSFISISSIFPYSSFILDLKSI